MKSNFGLKMFKKLELQFPSDSLTVRPPYSFFESISRSSASGMTSEPAGSDEIVNWIIHVTCPSQGPRPAQPIAILFFPQHYAIIQKTPAKAC